MKIIHEIYRHTSGHSMESAEVPGRIFLDLCNDEETMHIVGSRPHIVAALQSALESIEKLGAKER